MQILRNVLIGVVLLCAVFAVLTITAKQWFDRKVSKEVAAFYDQVRIEESTLETSDIEELPLPVQKWLTYTGAVSKKRAQAVRLQQRAQMRLGVDKPWMPVTAEQYFRTEEPGFIWKANIQMAPFVHISGRDKYEDGKGHMLIKILSLFTVADAASSEINQGTLLRYLAETMWVPSAVVSKYISWEAVDDHTAVATMTYKGVEASGTFTFNDAGQVISFQAERYGDFGGETQLETWFIPVDDYKEFEGVRIPTTGKVTWKLESGDYNWYNFEVIGAEYDIPKQYE